ncbi:TIGR03545 family protein [Botrimarina hoheduenensis]|uniref:TIGR03545 family protein n=1 Tax=Botrimarina hoheduenensis TaxID=2528000 RepID=A0A5C5WD80_9BACT|nr:TIGR03545 family protein [Botrimarina hoheduenensis]TWT47622.1 hypothetical protein Pla111_12380 [Botrimarina hoheduenensis]
MNRYIRIGYVAPRLVGALLLYILIEVGAGIALRQSIIQGGQAAVGARVEVREVAVSLRHARATIEGLQLANPSRPMENLLEADRLELDFDGNSLLRRKAIVDHAVLRGARFGVPRETSGALDPSDKTTDTASFAPWITEGAKNAATAWAEKLGGDIEGRLQSTIDEFESPRLADELAERWPARYQALRDEADALRDEARRFRDELRVARENPLRYVDQLAAAPSRLRALTARLKQLQTDVASLPREIEADRQQIAVARRADESRLRASLAADQLDANSLTTQLLGDTVTQPIAEAISWLRWVRRMTPSTKATGNVTPASRGVDVQFLGLQQRPNLLIRALDIEGSATLAGRPVEMTGVLTGLTTEPSLHGEPMRLVLSTTGGAKLEVRATIDRSTPVPSETIHIDCPNFTVPRLELGPAAGLALRTDPSVGNLTVSLQTEGEALSGQMQLVQEQLQIEPALGPNASAFSARLAEAAAGRLGRLNRAATRVDLAGTLNTPKVTVWSSLGTGLAESLRGAAEGVISQERERLLAASSEDLAERLARFDAALRPLQEAVSGAVEGSGGDLKSLSSAVLAAGSGRGSLSFEKLGQQLPKAGSLFR